MTLLAIVEVVDGDGRCTVMSKKAQSFAEAFEAITTCTEATISTGVRGAIERMRGGSFLAGRYVGSIRPVRPRGNRGGRRRGRGRPRLVTA